MSHSSSMLILITHSLSNSRSNHFCDRSRRIKANRQQRSSFSVLARLAVIKSGQTFVWFEEPSIACRWLWLSITSRWSAMSRTHSKTIQALEGVWMLWLFVTCKVQLPPSDYQYWNSLLVSTMKQKIKIALCVRALIVLMGPGLYYLLSNTFIVIGNDDSLTNDGK